MRPDMEDLLKDTNSNSPSIYLLYEETKRRLDELTILYEMTKISHSALSFDQMLNEMTRALQGFFHFEILSVLLIDEMTGRLTLHPSAVGSSPHHVEPLELKVGRGLTGWAVANQIPLRVNDVRSDPRYVGNGEGVLSEMCVPLIVEGKVIGVIDAQSQKLNAFTDESFRLFALIAEHLARIIENARSEERYRSVVENALDGVLVMSDDFRLTYVNERLSALLGYEREELIGVEFIKFLDEKSQETLKKSCTLRQAGEEGQPRYEVNIQRRDGDIRSVEIRSTLIRDYHGNSNHVAFLKDITEKRKMEEQLLQAEKLRALGEMASGVAHDFNNALAIILGNTQLLLLGAKDKEQVDTLKIIEKVAKDSAHTVRRLQEFTNRKTQSDLNKMDINAIVKDAVEITRPKWKDEAQRRGTKIKMATHLGSVPPAAGNVSELREVLINMIFNAVEAMPPEGGMIEIKTFAKGEAVSIQISDTGLGMTEEVRQKIFEPFFTTKPFTNTGLGLSMAYGIIQRFGGQIEVESEPGKGTTFTIVLHTNAQGGKQEEPFETIHPAKRARILVIDDEPHVREVISRGLSIFNHEVMEASSGEQGLELFQEGGFDLVLTDLGMPNLSGWEVCKAIKKINPKTPVGMITGWGMALDETKKNESGVDFVISKPFDFAKILTFVAESVGHRE